MRSLLPSSLGVLRLRALRRAGDRAMAMRRWAEAADHYRQVLSIRPIPAIMVQYGHALKEMGDMRAAERAYGGVPSGAPEYADARFHRAFTLERLGEKENAVALLVELLHGQPGHREAFAGLVRLNARDKVPEDLRRWTLADMAATLDNHLGQLRQQFNDWAEMATYPLSAYDRFRHDFPVRPPPANGSEMRFSIIIDARRSAPAFIRDTLLSLLDQTVASWSATVHAGDAVAGHSVASLAALDERISFTDAPPLAAPATSHLLHLSAGTVLETQALAWFAFTAERTGCAAAWCDHDHAAAAWSGMLRYSHPRLWGIFDVDMMAQTSSPPLAILVAPSTATLLADIGDLGDQEFRRSALIRIAQSGLPVAHIPRPLATALRLPYRAVHSPNDPDPVALWSVEPSSAPPDAGPVIGAPLLIRPRAERPPVSIGRETALGAEACIQVIVQTRDAVDSLRDAIDSLRDLAANPARLEITIVDNRSEDADTLSYLAKLERTGVARVMRLDQPFNWAHANNVAAAASRSPYLVFANNDIVMLTRGWDRLLVDYLERDDVGAVGTRLLYPDRSIQHGGVLLGIGDGGPLHDGVQMAAENTGPMDRWDTARAAAAVTGAFLGTARPMFEQIGGFEAKLFAIAYNDLDFCFSVRAAGKKILYTPAIELIHEESKSRGLNIGRGRVAWDIAEFFSFRERWPDDWDVDPSYNIHWSVSRPYDGFRDPSTRRIVAAIDRSVKPDPWRTRSR